MQMLTKRVFLQSALSSLAIAPAVLTANARASQGGTNELPYFFYDERFAEARRLAASFAAPASPTPVGGDVTALWTEELGALSRRAPLFLRGATTESFYFCLKTLLQSETRVTAEVERISKDLHAWSIRSAIVKKTG